jgi:aminoglycoside phosphotransferase (APT) family kinase protein
MFSPDPAIPLEPGEIPDADALATLLQDRAPGLEPPIQFFKFTAGNSNLSYLARAANRELVLKREPPGVISRSAHDMRREFRVISAVRSHYAFAPNPVFICEDPQPLGGVFFAMDRVNGVIFRQDNATKLSDLQAREQFLGLISALAMLHDLEVSTGELAKLGRPEGYRERQVSGWTTRMGDAHTPDTCPSGDIERWLLDNLPSEVQQTALVHNDFKMDNLAWDPGDPTRLIAVLDWEMATLGDPLMDLCVTLSFWPEPSDPESFRAQRAMPSLRAQIPSRADAWGAYLTLRGLNSGGFRFYLCFALYRRAVIEQQKYFRYTTGQSRDSRFAGLNVGARALLDMCRHEIETSVQA